MVQVLKKVKLDGEIHETIMTFSDEEWGTIQKHYPAGGVSFQAIPETLISEKKASVAGREKDDDKPKMMDYNTLKDMGMDYFKNENWDKAMYYFEEARKLKNFGWLNGKISQCKKNSKAESIAKRTPIK